MLYNIQVVFGDYFIYYYLCLKFRNMQFRLLILLLVAITAMGAHATSDLSRLEEVLKQRESYIDAKETRIDSLKRTLYRELSEDDRLACYDKLYREYLTFRFDSAMVYIDKAEALLGDNASYVQKSKVKIHRALSLATSGHFSQAVDILRSIDTSMLDIATRSELYGAMEWTYGVWAEYSGNTGFAKDYNNLSIAYLDSLLSVTDNGTPSYEYHFADYCLRNKDYEKARNHYIKALKSTPQNVRLYAQAAYGLATAYKELGDKDRYREWLINAAISDQITPLKENLALQQLALDIKTNEGDLETANRYLKYSLDDAIFYNNRLRMLEISEKFPDIILEYQDRVTAQNGRLKLYVLCIAILLLGVVVVIFLVIKEKRIVQRSKQEQTSLNTQLQHLNTKLSQATAMRLKFTGLFMDLCAAYIEKFNRFQSTVALKLKVGQIEDLTRIVSNNARPTETELREIFITFDTAFLKLYPDFITQFNHLLKPDKAILPKKNELLNTDLRIFALIRMGITDSNKIATLLFYSPQTIFNHRTQVRNRAINRETFEQEVMDICAVVPDDNDNKP